MKRTIAAAALAAGVTMTTTAAHADRGVNTVLGTAAGFVVFGPVGAVAGAAVGYTAGNGIARSWGVSRPARKVRRTKNR